MSITSLSQAMLNHGDLFNEDDQDILPSQMGFLAPMISSSNLNALKTLISDSPSSLSSDQFLLSSRQPQDFYHPLGKSQIYPLQRSSSANLTWACGEMEERMRDGKRNSSITSHGENYDHEHVHIHHLGVGAMKMKKVIKARRKVREPRFCFKTMSDVDVLDDGYKWRKYGQKVVKNTQHPRSYYRCTQENCRVKKRVERLAEDPRMVITTYEGRHVHSPSHDYDDQNHSPNSSHHHQLSNFFW